MEIAKACIQLLVVVGLGGVVGVVLRSIDERREERRARDERRFAIFQQIVDAYHCVKLVRRSLRTVGLRDKALAQLRPEQLASLRDGMTKIIEADLTLEQIDRELETRRVYDRTDDLRYQLQRILGYLSPLVEEWEKNGGKLWSDQQAVRVQDLPKLQAFLGPAGSDFRPHAADPMGWIGWIVRDELLGSGPSRPTDPAVPPAHADTVDPLPAAPPNRPSPPSRT
jgi:hypothetical protein